MQLPGLIDGGSTDTDPLVLPTSTASSERFSTSTAPTALLEISPESTALLRICAESTLSTARPGFGNSPVSAPPAGPMGAAPGAGAGRLSEASLVSLPVREAAR